VDHVDHDTTTSATAVGVLLAAAGITPSPDEVERFVRIYPVLRAQADGMYAAAFSGEALALGYDPTIGFH